LEKGETAVDAEKRAAVGYTMSNTTPRWYKTRPFVPKRKMMVVRANGKYYRPHYHMGNKLEHHPTLTACAWESVSAAIGESSIDIKALFADAKSTEKAGSIDTVARQLQTINGGLFHLHRVQRKHELQWHNVFKMNDFYQYIVVAETMTDLNQDKKFDHAMLLDTVQQQMLVSTIPGAKKDRNCIGITAEDKLKCNEEKICSDLFYDFGITKCTAIYG
jgi:hypothetical protein